MKAGTDSTSPPRKSRLAPILLVILFALPLVGMTWWSIRGDGAGRSRIAEYEERIRARGEPLTLADLEAGYPQLPEAENGATAILAVWEQEEPVFWRSFRLGIRPLPERAQSSWDPDLPFLGKDARRMPRSAQWSETNRMAAESFVEANRERLDAMRKAIRKPPFRFPVQISEGFNALLPHLAAMRNEAERFRIVTDLATEKGEVTDALAGIEDIVFTGNTLKSEPFLISQLVRISIYVHALGASERLLCRHSLSESQLNILEQHLNGIQATNMLLHVLLSERAVALSVFDMPPDQLASVMGNEQDSQRAFRWGMRVMSVTGMKQADRLLMLETMERAVALAETNSAESLREFEGVFARLDQEAKKFPPRIFSAMFLPSLQKVPARCATLEARRRAALVAIAVERQRVSSGGIIPGSLNEIPSGDAAPLDPYDDKPLRYRPQTNGFVVYSIGPNRKDDGGTERPESGRVEDYDDTFVVERD
jgi:hypothetical protein